MGAVYKAEDTKQLLRWGMPRDLARVWSLDAAEQQADHYIPPEQTGELLANFGSTPVSSPGSRPGHNSTQGGTACLACYRVERTRHFGGLDHLSDRQYGDTQVRKMVLFP
jgi:hypothetical protein